MAVGRRSAAGLLVVARQAALGRAWLKRGKRGRPDEARARRRLTVGRSQAGQLKHSHLPSTAPLNNRLSKDQVRSSGRFKAS
jgi:hypothetical protein